MPATVLLVDDHPTFGATAQILLEADAFEVVEEAGDGASAVSEAPRLRPPGRAPGRAAARYRRLSGGEAIMAHSAAPATILVSSHDASDFGLLRSRSPARGFVSKAELCDARVESRSSTVAGRRPTAPAGELKLLDVDYDALELRHD